MDISKRSLIKASLAASAAMAMGMPMVAKEAEAADDTKFVKGVCRMCGTGCSLYVGVKNGKLVSIRGNRDSKTNLNGLLCIKGQNIWKVAAHPDRLTTPLIRKNGKLVKASWDEALNLIEQKFKHFHKTYGYESVAYYGSGQCTTEESYTFNKLFKGGFGCNHVDGNPRLCMASAVAGYLSSFGSDEPAGAYEDLEKSKCLFITGSNTFEAHPILFGRIQRHKRNNPGVKIIVCEPRKTQTSKIADLWMPFKPGTDVYVFNGMAREIIKNGWHDKAFIDKLAHFVQGVKGQADPAAKKFEDYVAFLEEYTPEYVEKMSGCPAQSVKDAAKMFATSGATMSLWCMGLNQRANGVFANNMVHNLHIITGMLGKPGADSFSLTGQPNACGGVRETGSLSHLLPGCKPVTIEPWRKKVEEFWQVAKYSINPTKAIKPTPGFHTVKMFSSIGGENEQDKPIKGLIISTTNPAQTLPNTSRFIEGMKKCFTVVIDIFPTRTAQLASVVLPAAFLYEKGGVYGCSERRSFLTTKAIEAPGEAKPDLWIACQIAKRMGLGDFIQWSKETTIEKMREGAWNDYITCTGNTEKTLKGATYARLEKSKTGVQWPCPDEKHPGTVKRYVKGMDPIFDDPARYGYKHIPANLKNGEMFQYTKPNGKFFVWLRPASTADSEAVSAEYPFLMTTGRVLEQWHTGTMTMRIGETAKAHPHSYVEIHEDDAKKLGIKQNDMVKVSSKRGSNILPAHIIGKNLLPGVCYVPMHDQLAERMVNFVCSDAIDPTSAEPDYKVSAVKLERISGPVQIKKPNYLVTMEELNNPTFS